MSKIDSPATEAAADVSAARRSGRRVSRWIAITLAITVLIGLVGFGLGFQRADDSLNFYRDDPGSSTLTIVATTGSAEIWVRPYIVEQDEQSVVIGMWVWQDRIRPHTAIGVERTYALELDQPLGDREVRTADGTVLSPCLPGWGPC